MNRLVTILIFVLVAYNASAQSIFSNGDWYKIEVRERGVYKLTYGDLRGAGVPVRQIDPKTIKIYSYLPGIIPQANNIERPFDPFEIKISVIGEDDGSFDNDDYVLFYAQSAHTYQYSNGELTYQHNPYSETNYYFLSYGNENGARIETVESIEGDYPLIEAYDDFQYYEREQNNILTSGREWYSERFSTNTSQRYFFEFDNLIPNSEMKITTAVMAQAFQNSSFEVSTDGSLLGSIEVPSIPNFNLRNFRYAIKGYDRVETFSTVAPNTNSVEVDLRYNKNTDFSIGFLNYILVESQNELQYQSEPIQFRSVQSTENMISTYAIKNASSNLSVWNVTNPDEPISTAYETINNDIQFSASSESLKEYIIFGSTNTLVPLDIEEMSNQNLKGLSGTEFLIVAHESFLSEARRLANFRQSNDGLQSTVVNINEIYNEFSGGRQDVSAIRDFAKYLYDNGNLKYLLLFGRGSYDYKDVITDNTNFVPIYESRNSLDPLDTYASDDYYGFLEGDEGEWLEISNGAHTLDIGVGRLPVTNETEARSVVDKIINYATNPETIGKWRNDVVFVADDGDFNLHQRQADELTVFVDTVYSAFEPYKFYLDDFPQVSKPSGETSPEASSALNDRVNDGALIVNFTGHGGENGWMQEQVLDIVQIQEWTNYNQLPLFVTATCEFGRHDDPRRISAGEMVVTSDKGGGIAIVSTCRPVSSASNFRLNKAFYEVVYEQENGQYLRLGDIFRLTKNNENANSVGNRNFALLGDPTVRLSYPNQQIVITEINGKADKSDTLKAQSKVSFTGEVRLNNQINTSFNGIVEFVIHDKAVEKVTLGNENTPFRYLSKDNIIFKGSSSVQNGSFELEFIVPKNISYKVGNGEINMYAYDEGSMNDANGSEIALKIGSSENVQIQDNTGPSIRLNIGDSLNTRLSGVSHNTNLIVLLEDESGINLSGFGSGNNITAVLDDTQTFILNDYYVALKDTYQKGLVSFPLENLSKGIHKITVRASDVFNNASEATIEFTVADPNEVVIYEIKNFPNPFTNSTQFSVLHNRSGENLEISLNIISPVAGSVIQKEFLYENSSSEIVFYDWNGESITGEKLTPGLYIYQVTLRSTRDGAKNIAHKKLMLIN